MRDPKKIIEPGDRVAHLSNWRSKRFADGIVSTVGNGWVRIKGDDGKAHTIRNMKRLVVVTKRAA